MAVKKQNNYLELFKKLEAKLKELAGNCGDTKFGDIVKKASDKNYYVKERRDILSDLYGLRNVLAHSDREKYISEINQLAFDEINDFLKNLEHPPKVNSVFSTEIYSVTTNDFLEDVLKKMKEKLFTHIPVYQDSKFIGVLTETSILDWLVDNIHDGRAEFDKKTIAFINKRYLNCPTNRFRFISEKTSIFEVQELFEKAIKKEERLGVIFVTENGEKEEKITGIITAWDLPKIRTFLR